jgi:peptide/nickel transport system substrate-binding protein
MASPLVAVTPGGAPIAPVPLDRLPPGTGPFVPYRADGQTIRCRPNRGYWVLGQPRFDGCVVTTVGNEIERTSRLVTGLVDIIPDVPALDIPLLQNDPGVSVTGDISRRQVAMVLNLNREPLNDVRVRQAIAAAIDRSALGDGATAGTAVPSWTLFPSDHWAGVPDFEPAQPSAPEATRAALAALDLLPGWSLRLACPDDQPTLANTAILLQEQLGAIGIALGIDLLDAATLDTARAEGEFDLMMTFLPSWVDPHEIAYPWLHSAGPRNAGGFVSPRIDRLLDRARSQPDEIVRGALYADIQHTMFDQVPLVPLFATQWVDAVRARVAGYTAQLPPSARGIASAWFEAP